MPNSGRKRFNDDQIKSLESTFESESRPELQLKQHLANRLGLQPRQIAIWFQNKRARSKSKQVERELSLLKSKYHNLASQLDALRNENQTLVSQVQTLRKLSEENEKKNMMTSPKNPGDNLKKVADQNMMRKVENNLEFEEEEAAAAVFDRMPQITEDECCTFLDNSDCASLWWQF